MLVCMRQKKKLININSLSAVNGKLNELSYREFSTFLDHFRRPPRTAGERFRVFFRNLLRLNFKDSSITDAVNGTFHKRDPKTGLYKEDAANKEETAESFINKQKMGDFSVEETFEKLQKKKNAINATNDQDTKKTIFATMFFNLNPRILEYDLRRGGSFLKDQAKEFFNMMEPEQIPMYFHSCLECIMDNQKEFKVKIDRHHQYALDGKKRYIIHDIVAIFGTQDSQNLLNALAETENLSLLDANEAGDNIFHTMFKNMEFLPEGQNQSRDATEGFKRLFELSREKTEMVILLITPNDKGVTPLQILQKKIDTATTKGTRKFTEESALDYVQESILKDQTIPKTVRQEVAKSMIITRLNADLAFKMPETKGVKKGNQPSKAEQVKKKRQEEKAQESKIFRH